jgi:RNA polymerase sigma-70 factor (ECF subfamily)
MPWETVWEEEWNRNFTTLALERVRQKVKPRQYQLFDCLVLKKWPVQQVKEKLHATSAQIYFAKYKVVSLLQRELRLIHRRWEESGRDTI